MLDNYKKVIGYFAIRTGTPNILCDGDACVIGGSYQAMNRYIVNMTSDKISRYTIKKTRYGEILQGMRMGGVYAFDKNAYERFYPLAKRDGMNLVEFQIEDEPRPNGYTVRFMRVQWFD